jgi:hypothetical protein
MGLPSHVLLVHAAVVLVPLLALGAVVYALVPRLRPQLYWPVVVLAVAAPLAALFAKVSGDAFFVALQDLERIGGDLISQVQRHQTFGTITAWVSGALGIVTLVLAYLASGRAWPARLGADPDQRRMILLGVTVVTVGLALVTGFYAFQTGDSGARVVWEPILQQ